MKQRFETFVTAISSISRSLLRLKNTEMADLGLKGTHVMCLYQLQQHPQGLTAAGLSRLCDEDKAAISRALSELRELDLVWLPEDRRYRQPIRLTERGLEVTAVMDRKIADAVMAASQGYSPEEREIFTRVLLQVAENLQAACMKEENP